jgi:hypothetical protein
MCEIFKKDPILEPIGMFEDWYLPNIGKPMLDRYCTIDEHKFGTILAMIDLPSYFHYIHIIYYIVFVLHVCLWM